MTTFTLGHTISSSKSIGLRQFILCRLSLMQQRKALAKLDAHRLADIGVSQTLAHQEASRPFWDAPAHWRH